MKLAPANQTPLSNFLSKLFSIEDPAINDYMSNYGTLPALAG